MTERDFAALLEAQQRQIERLSMLLERNTAAMAAADSVRSAADTALIADILNRYNSEMLATNPKWKHKVYQLSPLRLYFGEMRACDVKPTTWSAYAIERMAGRIPSGGKLGVKIIPTTVNHEMIVFRVALKWAVDRGILTKNPMLGVKRIPNARANKQGALKESDLDAILRACPNLMTKVFLVVELDSGLRRAECLALRWPDIDFDGKIIHVRNGKGDKPRDVVTTQRAIDWIRRLPQDGEWPFMNRQRDEPYSLWTINVWVREAVEASGVQARYGGRKIRNHGMRRGHATNAIERGVDIRAVSENLGHASIATTEGYVDSRMEHRRRVFAEKFEVGIGLREMPRIGPKRAGEDTPPPERLKVVK